MADTCQLDIAGLRQALVVLRHDVVVVRCAHRNKGDFHRLGGKVAQPLRAGFHFAGILADGDARHFAALMRRGEGDQAIDPGDAVAGEIGAADQPPHAVGDQRQLLHTAGCNDRFDALV